MKSTPLNLNGAMQSPFSAAVLAAITQDGIRSEGKHFTVTDSDSRGEYRPPLIEKRSCSSASAAAHSEPLLCEERGAGAALTLPEQRVSFKVCAGPFRAHC